MENIDWKSCRSKYVDFLDKYKEVYPTAEDAEKLGKDFPHNKEDITKLIVTSKLKSVRVKYRQAVDSGRRSGHGRVVLLYFELCEQIWGASPATVMVSSGIETTDMVVVIDDNDDVNEDAGDGDVVDQISQPGIFTTSPASSFSDSLSESFESSDEGSAEKLPANESEALARGQMLPSVQRGLFLGPPTSSSYSAFTSLSPTIPHGIPLSAVDYHAASKCANGQCPGCIYYPGAGPVPSVRNPLKEHAKRRTSDVATSFITSITGHIPTPMPTIPGLAKLPNLEDMRYSHSMWSATAALMILSSTGRVLPGDRMLLRNERDRSPLSLSPQGSPKSEANEKH
ncbi:hypothetical protein P5673_029547 [Acropora cervicornis]|uniref:Uncharacterized protein n=1 Tax=Acropora cervicornis TaxID=6130 RepID=A0AAD9PVN4_ACRCE|nr:hypothetical protein P5673_029547 [Acropora cervicornis]